MKIHIKLHIAKVTISIFMIMITSVMYSLYQKQFEQTIDKVIQAEVFQTKQSLITPLFRQAQSLKEDEIFLTELHAYTLHEYQKDTSIDLKTLKQAVNKSYRLSDIDIDIFLINKDYKIYETTYAKDQWLDLSKIFEAREIIDNAFSNGRINLSKTLLQDPFDNKYKLYSYAKSDDNTILEMSFTYKDDISNIVYDNQNHKNLNLQYFIVSKEDNHTKYSYIPRSKGGSNVDKVEFYNSRVKFNNKEINKHPVAMAYFDKENVFIKSDDKVIVYSDISIDDMIGEYYHNIVLKFEVDISEQNAISAKVRLLFVVILVSIFIMMMLLDLFIKKTLIEPVNVLVKHIQKGNFIEYEKLNRNSELSQVAIAYNTLLESLNMILEKNKELIFQDYLTKIGNRKAYDLKLAELLTQFDAADSKQSVQFTLLLFDLDDFKEVNDNFGHAVGDEVLIKIARIVKDNIRDTDFVYRVGGEEFLVVFPQTALDDAFNIAEQFREKIAISFVNIRENSVTISAGLVMIQNGDDSKALYKRADTLMYNAKHNGKNQISL